MELYKMLKLEDLPNDWQEYAKSNNIKSINDFSVADLFAIYGDAGCQIYLGKLTTNRNFMLRIISEHYRQHSPQELQKELRLSHSYAYSLWREVHQKPSPNSISLWDKEH